VSAVRDGQQLHLGQPRVVGGYPLERADLVVVPMQAEYGHLHVGGIDRFAQRVRDPLGGQRARLEHRALGVAQQLLVGGAGSAHLRFGLGGHRELSVRVGQPGQDEPVDRHGAARDEAQRQQGHRCPSRPGTAGLGRSASPSSALTWTVISSRCSVASPTTRTR